MSVRRLSIICAALVLISGRESGIRAAGDAGPPRSLARAILTTPHVDYPVDAVHRRIEGRVFLIAIVNAAGDVTDIHAGSGPEELRDAALGAGRQVKYERRPEPSSTILAFDFQLIDGFGNVRLIDRIAPERPGRLFGPPREASAGPIEYALLGTVPSPKKIKDVFPVCPPDARADESDGYVTLDVTVDATGNVVDAKPLSSTPQLGQAAADAARQWRYEPTRVNGFPVPVTLVAHVFVAPDRLKLELLLPDGTTATTSAGKNGDVNFIDLPGVGYFGFGVPRDRADDKDAIAIDVYELQDGRPKRIDTVPLVPGGGPVQTSTTPAFAIRLN